MTITYTVGDGLYLNITNRCSNNCTFCVRSIQNSVGDADDLWLEREPALDEIITDINKRRLSAYEELVFCGYGEPLYRLADVLEICEFVKEKTKGKLPIRINTNGLADLINSRPTAKETANMADTISISLNAPTPEKYNQLCRSEFGEQAFPAILAYAKECKENGAEVTLTAVDVIPTDELEACKKIANSIGVKFRVRESY